MVRMRTGVDDDLLDLEQVCDFPAHAEREINQRLRLIFRAVLFGKALKNGALGLSRRWERNAIMGLGSVEHPRDHAVIPLVDRARRSLATHRAIDGFNG